LLVENPDIVIFQTGAAEDFRGRELLAVVREAIGDLVRRRPAAEGDRRIEEKVCGFISFIINKAFFCNCGFYIAFVLNIWPAIVGFLIILFLYKYIFGWDDIFVPQSNSKTTLFGE